MHRKADVQFKLTTYGEGTYTLLVLTASCGYEIVAKGTLEDMANTLRDIAQGVVKLPTY